VLNARVNLCVRYENTQIVTMKRTTVSNFFFCGETAAAAAVAAVAARELSYDGLNVHHETNATALCTIVVVVQYNVFTHTYIYLHTPETKIV
jgi:hypothetical protein